MVQTLAQHKFILIGVSILVAGGIWYGLSASAPPPDLVTTPVESSPNPVEKDLVTNLLALRTVKLDGTILNNPAFMSLKDFSTEIVPEPIGRDNPFAPLGGQAFLPVSTKDSQISKPRP